MEQDDAERGPADADQSLDEVEGHNRSSVTPNFVVFEEVLRTLL